MGWETPIKTEISRCHGSHPIPTSSEMVGLGGSKLNHPDLQPTRIIKDEADVQALVSLMGNSWINPFGEDQDNLVNLATAAMATTDIANDLANSSKIGEAAYQLGVQNKSS